MTTLTVGTGLDYTTLADAVAAAKPGDTIDLQAGTYTNDFPALIDGLTIEGVGGIAKLVATNQPGNGKAILDVAGDTTLKNLDISGVTVPDANGAAIRYEGGNLVIENTAIHGNQDGILGAPDPNGTITIDQSEIYDNGTGAGNTHNIYIGDIATFTLTNSYIHDANTGHEVKSRAETNVITNNRIEDNSSTASYEIDLPNGGNATISGNTIQKSVNSGNHVTIAYGEEYDPSSTAPEHKLNAGTDVTLSNNTFVNDQPGAYVVWDTTGAPITASGNTTYDYSQIDKSGYVSSSGFTATTTRPTLDTSSPIDQSDAASTHTSTPDPTPTPTPDPTPTPTPTPPADTTAPAIPTLTQSVSGTTTQTSNVISGTATDAGTGVAQVEIYDTTGGNTVDLGRATLNGSAWNYTASNLALGSHAFSAVATDNAGNLSAPVSVAAPETIVAPTPPPKPTPTPTPTPVVTRPTLQSVSRSGLDALAIKGTAKANSKITLTDTVGGKTHTVGTTTANSEGSWSISTKTINIFAVNSFTATATSGKTTTASAGSLVLSSVVGDTVSATAGKPDVFAYFPSIGHDVIKGFETAAAAATNHDVIDLSRTAYHSFEQLQPNISGAASAVIRLNALHTITVSGVNAHSLTATDFRFT